MRKLKLIIASLFLVSPLAANADIIWDEGTDGDLATSFPATDLGALGVGAFDIIGSLNGGAEGDTTDGHDEFDLVSFIASDVWTLDMLSLSPSPFVIFLYDAGTFLGGFTVNDGDTNVFGARAAGEWWLAFTPLRNGGGI